MNRKLSNANRMVWELFHSLRRHCHGLTTTGNDEAVVRQDAAVCILLAVQCVEVFLNVFFRVVVEEDEFRHAKKRILEDLDGQAGIDRKIKEWPELVFGRKLTLGSGMGQRFVELKNLRNRLTHFSSTYETMIFSGFAIEGMSNTSDYDTISGESGIAALEVAENFICEILALRGISTDQLPHALHSWTGRPPAIH